LRSRRALDGCICSWFLPPFCQDGLNHFQDTKLKVVTLSVQVFQSYSSVRREESKSCSSYLSYSPDKQPFFAGTFSLYALLSTCYCNWMLIFFTVAPCTSIQSQYYCSNICTIYTLYKH
jgi:hypothetical protein